MKTIHRSLVIALLVSSTVAGFAQDHRPRGGRGPQGPGPRGPEPFIRALDTDKDGVISATELANASAALLARDRNSDGKVTLDELRPARPADAPTPPADAPALRGRGGKPPAGAPKHHGGPALLALDADGDHELSATEIAAASASLAALDANKDGQLTRDELCPLPPQE